MITSFRGDAYDYEAGGPSRPVDITVQWSQTDPASVYFRFGDADSDTSVEWCFARVLLTAGTRSADWQGRGDVKVKGAPHGRAAVLLDNGTDAAIVATFPRHPVEHLLREAAHLVPEWSGHEAELMARQVEHAIAALLGQPTQ